VKLLPDQWTSEQFDKVDWDLLNTTLAKKKNMYTLWSPEPKISENGPEPEFLRNFEPSMPRQRQN
jgi:hypothetical protein